MSNGAGPAGPSAAKKREPRVVWTSQETWTLIRLWEGRMEDLRRAKRNGGVYEEIAEELLRCGIVRTKGQVHTKIENLTNTYRKHLREGTTTGSGAMKWPFFWDLNRLLGSLPLNDTTLVDESLASNHATPAVVELLSDMQEGGVVEVDYFEEPVEEPGEELRGEESQVTSTPATTSVSRPGPSSVNGTSNVPPRPQKRKRPQAPSTAYIKTVIDEQRLLRQSFEASRAREFALREREIVLQETAIKVQQELATSLMAFMNKNAS
ncbi:uncharacterized protein ISCGN_015036 [Ixodes scapularis]